MQLHTPSNVTALDNLAIRINTEHEACRASMRKGLEHALEAGPGAWGAGSLRPATAFERCDHGRDIGPHRRCTGNCRLRANRYVAPGIDSAI